MPRGQPSGFTGANAIPLGSRNKAIGAKKTFSSSPPKQEDNKSSGDAPSSQAAKAFKAAQAAAASLSKLVSMESKDVWAPPSAKQSYGGGQPPRSGKEEDDDRGRKRKRKSRWGSMIRTEIPGMPATIPTHLTQEQQKAYIIQLQIEDITRKLKSGDMGIPINPEDRSPSPEPIYNGEGKRMNTREYRTRKRLEEERHRLIQQMLDINSEYKPPIDYKPTLQRMSERVMIPQDINPNINFVGLLIGPRGNTLKKIEKETNCKIMIRGKGSVKEGKIGRKDGQPLPGEDEPLHALVSSTCVENVKKAVDQINEIIKQGIEQPEEENDLRKLQLMELAKLNGTLREDLMPKERAWLKPENQNITNTTVCTKCGGRGHLAQDCVAQAPSMSLQAGAMGSGPDANVPPNVDRAKMDSEYMSLMAELGEGPTSGDGGQMNSGRFNNGPPSRFGGPRQQFMGQSGGNRFNGPSNQRPRFGGRGGGGNNDNRPSMNQNAPPPQWMPPGPYGGLPPSSGPNQWGQQGGMGPPFGNFPNAPPPSDGSMPPWMQNPDGSNMMAPMGMGSGGSGNGMYGGNSDQNAGGNFYNQPPPPPPSSAPQPPPPPSSGVGMGNAAQWQQSWGGEQQDSSAEASGASNISTSGSNSYIDSSNSYAGAYGAMPPSSMGMDGSMSGSYGMGGYGNMAMWGMGSGAVPPPPGPVPPPMPSGPGPVPPPPPSGHGSGDTSQGGNDGYNSMGMMQGYGMPPAPPPPPPQ